MKMNSEKILYNPNEARDNNNRNVSDDVDMRIPFNLMDNVKFNVRLDENIFCARLYSKIIKPQRGNKISSSFGLIERASVQKKLEEREAKMPKNLLGSRLDDANMQIPDPNIPIPTNYTFDELDQDQKFYFLKVKSIVDRLNMNGYLTDSGEIKSEKRVEEDSIFWSPDFQKLVELIDWSSCVNKHWVSCMNI